MADRMAGGVEKVLRRSSLCSRAARVLAEGVASGRGGVVPAAVTGEPSGRESKYLIAWWPRQRPRQKKAKMERLTLNQSSCRSLVGAVIFINRLGVRIRMLCVARPGGFTLTSSTSSTASMKTVPHGSASPRRSSWSGRAHRSWRSTGSSRPRLGRPCSSRGSWCTGEPRKSAGAACPRRPWSWSSLCTCAGTRRSSSG